METGNGLGNMGRGDGSGNMPDLRGMGTRADEQLPAGNVQGARGGPVVPEPTHGLSHDVGTWTDGERTRITVNALTDAYRMATDWEDFYARVYDALNGELEGWFYGRLRTPKMRAWRDDLVQATWLKVWQKLPEPAAFDAPSGSPGRRIRAWVYQLATNLYVDWARRETFVFRDTKHADRLAALHRDKLLWFRSVDDDGNPERVYLRAERARIAGEIAAARLTPDRRAILQMFGDGLTYDEIAEVLGTTRIGVKSRLFRARAAIRPYLDDIDSP